MADPVKLAFEPEGVVLPLEHILPLKEVTDAIRKSPKYRSIMASLKEVGLIEPLVVYPVANGKSSKSVKDYILLDGHIRWDILKHFGETEVLCLVSSDDEAYTYNHKVNRMAPIQEHFMILKAIRNGVSEERIAKALDVDVNRIKEKRDLLNGICPEAVDILKDKQIPASALAVLKKVKPMRQLDIAEMMVKMDNYSRAYALAMVSRTENDQLVSPIPNKEFQGVKPEDMERMKREMESIEKEFTLTEEIYGKNVLDLELYRAYLGKLLDNARVVRFMSSHHSELLATLTKIVETTKLEPS